MAPAERTPVLRGKELELKERDQRYFDVARGILREEGFDGLTISRVAREVGFSKVTVYQRFGNKEELLAELGVRCRLELLRVMEQAAQIPGPPRIRVESIGEAIRQYSRRYAENVQILTMIRSEPILSKAPESLKDEMDGIGLRMFNVLLACTREAIAQGDLTLPSRTSPESLAYMMWVIVAGWAQTQCEGAAPLPDIDLPDPLGSLNLTLGDLFDGYGWRPLSSEFDANEVAHRVHCVLVEDPELAFGENLGESGSSAASAMGSAG